MDKKVLIVWAGAVGWYLWYLLENKGFEVSVIMKNNHKEIAHILDQDCMYETNFNSVSITEDWMNELSFSTVVIATKQYDIKEALLLSEKLISEFWKIIVIQNWLHNYNIPESIKWKVAKWVIYVIAKRIWDSIIKSSNFCKLFIENTGLETLNNELINLNSEVSIENEIKQVIREKLIHIASYSWVICYYWVSIGEIRKDSKSHDLYKQYLKEIYEIATLEGYKEKKTVFDYKKITQDTNSDAYCSLYYDLENWWNNEFYWIIWAVYELSKKLKWNYPTIELIVNGIKWKYFL